MILRVQHRSWTDEQEGGVLHRPGGDCPGPVGRLDQ